MFFETTLTTDRITDLVGSGAWTGRLLDEPLIRWGAERGERTAIIDRHGSVSWADFVTTVDHVSRGLLEIGVRPGDVVQLQLPNWRHFAMTVCAVERIGAVVNPVAPIFRHNEVAVMSELARPAVVVTAMEFRGFELGAMHAELREQCPWVRELVVVGDASPADAMTWEELVEQGRFSSYEASAVALVRPDPNDVCEVMFTSGTTGQPKGVMHTANTLNAAADLFLGEVCDGVAPGDGLAAGGHVFHMASTLAHQTGYLYGLRAPIVTGGTVVLQDVWDPVEFVALVAEHGIQISMGATPFLADVLGVDGVADASLGSWERFVCAGAAIPEPVLEQAGSTLPCVVMPGWGMTECGLATVGRPTDSFELRLTDGAPMPANEVRVVDEDGAPVRDEEGDLQYRGSLGFVGYVQGRGLTEQGLVDGWLDTGDRAIHRADGYIRIAGRSKDLVIRGGENVPVKEVEDVLLRDPSVAHVAVVAEPHDRLGEIGCAFVVPAAGVDPASITLASLTDVLAEHQVTRQFWPENLVVVDDLPMTASGKVQKFKLRATLLPDG